MVIYNSCIKYLTDSKNTKIKKGFYYGQSATAKKYKIQTMATFICHPCVYNYRCSYE